MIGFFNNQFVQVAYVTNDMDGAIERFDKMFGVSRWLRVPGMEMGLGGGRRLTMDMALAMAGGVQLELIAPLGGDDAVYRDALRADRPGLQVVHHHVAERMASLADFDALRDRIRANGLALPIDDQSPNGVHYLYVDTRETLGHHLEYVWYPQDYWETLNARVPVN